jgi:DNA primase
VLAAADLSTVEGRARAAEAVLPIVAEHPSELVRDQYLMELADRCRISVERLRARAEGGGAPLVAGRPASRPDPRGPAPRSHRRPPDRESPELEALRLALHRPEAVADALDEVLFADPVHLAAYRALAGAATLHEAIESADPDAADLLQRLAVEEEPDTDPADAVVRLVEEAARRTLAHMEAEMRASDDPMAYAPEVGWLKLRCEALRAPAPDLAVAGQLVAWLTGRGEEGA